MTSKLEDARLDLSVKRIGILYHPQLEKARDLADKLEGLLSSQKIYCWKCSAWDENKAKPQVAGSDLIFSIGGDGTILHVARTITPLSVPILGINLGKLGFITEVTSNEVLANLPNLLKGEGWIEERAMLEAQVEGKSFHALNDVVLRSVAVRLVNIEVEIDSEVITTYRADGVITATATGSTSYSLAAGGPILHPQSKEVIIQPISCHLGLSYALVLPSQSIVDLKVAHGDRVMLSLDGQIELPLSDGQNVRVKLSPHVARFLRTHQPTYFYSTLWQKLRGKDHEGQHQG